MVCGTAEGPPGQSPDLALACPQPTSPAWGIFSCDRKCTRGTGTCLYAGAPGPECSLPGFPTSPPPRACQLAQGHSPPPGCSHLPAAWDFSAVGSSLVLPGPAGPQAEHVAAHQALLTSSHVSLLRAP